jgi:hypothetical protein
MRNLGEIQNAEIKTFKYISADNRFIFLCERSFRKKVLTSLHIKHLVPHCDHVRLDLARTVPGFVFYSGVAAGWLRIEEMFRVLTLNHFCALIKNMAPRGDIHSEISVTDSMFHCTVSWARTEENETQVVQCFTTQWVFGFHGVQWSNNW